MMSGCHEYCIAGGIFVSRLKTVALVPLLTLFLSFILSGCATPQEAGAVKDTVFTNTDPVRAEHSVTKKTSLEQKKQSATLDAPSRVHNAPYRQMMQSAGRNPDTPQPERDFLLKLPTHARDGEAFFMEFAAEGARQISIAWGGAVLHVSRNGQRPSSFQVLLPVSLDEKSKSLPLNMTVFWKNGRTEVFKADMPVRKGKYPVQSLKVEQKYVTPPSSVQEKIKKDRAEMRAVLSRRTDRQYWTLPLLRPVPGEVTSLFGLRRMFNGVPKSPHKGVDFNAKADDPVKAVDAGVVVLVSEHYYGGRTVVIDHGLGVLSVYLHLSGFAVSAGQTVARGDVVGFIGSTGRVTGPHLHLSLYVLGESVNAAKCMDM